MKILLDTHTMLWWWTSPGRIPSPLLELLAQPENVLLASAVSGYELSYKHHLGKLALPEELLPRFSEIVAEEQWTPLPLSLDHSILAGSLDSSHRDPFDRLLAAQALTEKASLATADPAFQDFPGLDILW